MSANPLDSNGIEPGAFEGMTVFHIRIAEAKLTSIPKGLLFTLLTIFKMAIKCNATNCIHCQNHSVGSPHCQTMGSTGGSLVLLSMQT